MLQKTKGLAFFRAACLWSIILPFYPFSSDDYHDKVKDEFVLLRIPDSYDAKIAKICNLWTLCPVIQPIHNLTYHNVQKLQISVIFAS